MKNNNKSAPFHTIEIINELLKQCSKKNIPNVKKICSKTKENRNIGSKYLNKRWEQHQEGELSKDVIYLYSRSIPQRKELQHAIISLQCLAKELEIHSDLLNHLPNHSYPLGNIILHSLQEIENKLLVTYSYTNELNNDKKKLEEQLNRILHENKRLGEEINEMQHISIKKNQKLQQQLDAKKREILAANNLIKSLKREKRRPTLKSFFHDYNLIMNRSS